MNLHIYLEFKIITIECINNFYLKGVTHNKHDHSFERFDEILRKKNDSI